MKNQNITEVGPTVDEVMELLMRLAMPYRLMGWIMLETGTRYTELQRMLVRDAPAGRGWLRVGTRQVTLSPGLARAVDGYVRDVLRPAFEQLKRKSRGVLFPTVCMFPAWLLEGCEDEPVHRALSVADFVATLQAAAQQAGIRGMVNSNTLRLVAAREWLRQGMSITDLHERLGHDDLMTTLLLAQTLRHGGLTFAAAA